MATTVQCAKHLDMSERRFRELTAEGIIERKSGRGAYDLDKVRVAYIRHLREAAAGRDQKDQNGDESDALYKSERAKLMAIRAQEAEFELAKKRGEFVAVADIADAIASAMAVLKQNLLAIPTKLAGQMATARKPEICEQLMRDDIKSSLTALSKIKAVYAKSAHGKRAISTPGV